MRSNLQKKARSASGSRPLKPMPGRHLSPLTSPTPGLASRPTSSVISSTRLPRRTARPPAASAARDERFDMAIIDIDLPDVSGIDLVRRIKADPANTELRIVMLTLRDHEIDEFGEMRAYVAASLSKPVRQATLRHCLAALESGVETMSPPSELPPPPPPEGVAGARVLLVEDNPVNLEVAVGILESFGCKVETATNGVEALERYASSEYGLIFMDCQMPEMDGFEATSEIRKQEANSDRRTP